MHRSEPGHDEAVACTCSAAWTRRVRSSPHCTRRWRRTQGAVRSRSWPDTPRRIVHNRLRRHRTTTRARQPWSRPERRSGRGCRRRRPPTQSRRAVPSAETRQDRRRTSEHRSARHAPACYAAARPAHPDSTLGCPRVEELRDSNTASAITRACIEPWGRFRGRQQIQRVYRRYRSDNRRVPLESAVNLLGRRRGGIFAIANR